MNSTKYKTADKLYFLLVAILFVFLVNETFGQSRKIAEITKNKFALKNLLMGIQSANDGVRESSIYFAGKYRLIETENVLIEQLEDENNSDLKVLIGLALFRMGSEKGMEELQNLARIDKDPKVRRMCLAIYNEYVINVSDKTAHIQ